MKLYAHLKGLLVELHKLAKGGLFHIFGSSVISQVGGMISSFLVIRYLPKVDYGGYVSADNLYSYIAIFVGLGMTNAILQFCSEHVSEERKNAIYRYGFVQGTAFNLFLIVVILLLSLFKRQMGDSVAAHYLGLMCGLPLVAYGNSYAQIVLRIQRRNQEFARVNIICTIFAVSGNILFTRFLGVFGLILSTYLANGAAACVGFVLLQKTDFLRSVFRQPQRLPHSGKIIVTKYAALTTITNFTSTMLVLLDITCLDITLSEPNILADYKIASSLPSTCLFIPSAMITYFYPHMVESFSTGIEEFKKYFWRLVKVFSFLGLIVTAGLMILGPFMIPLFFGEKYANVTPIFVVLCLNYLVTASIRRLLGNAICAVKEVRVNLIHTVIAGILNIVLDLVLIQQFGPIGAAIATTIVTTFVAVLEILFFWRFFRRKPATESGS